MNHTLVYYGWYDHAVRHLHPEQDRYWRKDDDRSAPASHLVELPPKAKFDGFWFGFLEKAGKEYVYVRVDGVVLPQPVLHIPGRHGVQAPGPSFPNLNDDVAAAILADMIVENPSCRDSLVAFVRKLSG